MLQNCRPPQPRFRKPFQACFCGIKEEDSISFNNRMQIKEWLVEVEVIHCLAFGLCSLMNPIARCKGLVT